MTQVVTAEKPHNTDTGDRRRGLSHPGTFRVTLLVVFGTLIVAGCRGVNLKETRTSPPFATAIAATKIASLPPTATPTAEAIATLTPLYQQLENFFASIGLVFTELNPIFLSGQFKVPKNTTFYSSPSTDDICGSAQEGDIVLLNPVEVTTEDGTFITFIDKNMRVFVPADNCKPVQGESQ